MKIFYSILEYKHSLLREEAFQVGIVFYIPYLDNQIKFYHNAPDTLKTIYPDMDYSLLVHYLELIQTNIKSQKRIEPAVNLSLPDNLKRFLDQYILIEDASVLQFQTPAAVCCENLDTENILNGCCKLLLSFGYDSEK